MKYGYILAYGDARTAADMAYEAEQAGWDGFFVWEPVWGIDAWICLTAAAMRTERIRLGTMLSPLSRMRPWKIASETATLDNLSNGRVTLSVGLGATESGFEAFGEVTDRKTRAELLDESLDILTGLWQGQPFAYSGKHYQVKEVTFIQPPPPVQQPRIPIWVVGAYPSEKSMGRALRYDGLLPGFMDRAGENGATRGARSPTVDELRTIVEYVQARRPAGQPYDIIVEGETPGDDPQAGAEIVREWQAAGATWWLEVNWGATEREDRNEIMLKRIRQGPPRLA